jgi:mono/diheme cytochrome c family protein
MRNAWWKTGWSKMGWSKRVLAGAACVLAVGCRGWDSEKPPVHLIPNMDTQEKGKAYRADSTGLFADGRTMRPPVEGTVARGQLDDDDAYFKGTDDKNEFVVKFPASIKGDDGAPLSEVIARGEDRFKIFCTPCHGPTGDGDGVVNVSKGLLVPPPSMHSERVRELSNGKVYAAMLNGVNAGNMASYAAQIPVDDRWAIVAYIRDLERQKDPNQAWEPDPNGGPAVATNDPVALGKKLYKVKGCNACHSLDGSKLVGPTFQGIWGRSEKTNTGEVKVDEAYVTESILQPLAKVVDGYAPSMPPQNLTQEEINQMIAFFKTL